MPDVPEDYPNRTISRYAEYFRDLQASAEKYCSELPPEVGGDVGDLGVWEALLLKIRPNPVGEILFRIAGPNFTRFAHRRCALNREIAATRALVALKAYQDANGKLPDSLEALVPKYLDAVPRDDFDGEPLRYSVERRWLYSVGNDFVDAGGAADAEREAPARLRAGGPHDFSEPTFPIPFAAAAPIGAPLNRITEYRN